MQVTRVGSWYLVVVDATVADAVVADAVGVNAVGEDRQSKCKSQLPKVLE